MTKPLKNGDPCPCCGQPIQTDDPGMLVALTYIAELLGAVLYCPDCTATWDERNKGRPQPGPENTIGLIHELHKRSRRRRAHE